MDRPLHPNLARIAAAYDDVMLAYRAGQIGPVEARRRVLGLVARDDSGLEWSIDPDSGLWRYRSQFGDLYTAEPPTHGVAAYTPADLGAGTGDPERLHLFPVDSAAITRTGLASPTRVADPARRHLYRLVVVCAVALLLVLWAVFR